MDTNTVNVLNSYGAKVDVAFQALAAKAGLAADHFYPILVREQSIKGITSLALLCVALAGIFLAAKVFVANFAKANDPEGNSPNASGARCGVALILGLICVGHTLMACADLPENLGRVVNPEYSAVACLVHMVR